MSQLPRLAIGSAHDGVDHQPLCWALLALLSARGQQLQHFFSVASFPRLDGARAATGASSRHLDSWLMTPEACREAFVHGTSRATLAIVEGRYAQSYAQPWRGGLLDDLCDWLDLPRIAVIDASQIGDCRLPQRPRQADALLLDKLQSPQHFASLQTTLESLWGIPVLGGLDTLKSVRRTLASLPRGVVPSKDLCQDLAVSLNRYLRLDRLKQLAARHSFPQVRPFVFRADDSCHASRMNIAVAYDDAFRCYFPDALELLELQGATVVDFSPLRDEALPPDTDLVYLGCGHPERFATALAENHCMRFSLREHLCAGRRIYAEGGGLAYLCEHLVTPAGEHVPMVGVFPATATANPRPRPPVPTTITLSQRCWLGRPGTKVRGYLSSNWNIEPSGKLEGLASEPKHQFDLLGRYSAIASRMHVNFVPQPEILQSFLRPVPLPLTSC
jgi:cobyrinic acid a,c-diamide synthase